MHTNSVLLVYWHKKLKKGKIIAYNIFHDVNGSITLKDYNVFIFPLFLVYAHIFYIEIVFSKLENNVTTVSTKHLDISDLINDF